MSNLITLLIAGIFTDNLLTSKLLGLENVGEKTTPTELLKKCGALTVLLFVSSAVTYPVFRWVLTPLGAEYLYPFCAVIIVCSLLAAAFFLSKRYLPVVYSFLNKNRQVLTCSAVVLGLCLNAAQSDLVTGYLAALIYSLASSVGFAAVSFIFYAINNRLSDSSLPECVKGLPVTLIVASFISLAFSGFAGI